MNDRILRHKILLLLCFICCPICLWSAKYSVFKSVGVVKILRNNTWTSVKGRMSVTLKDKFQLEETAKLGIVDEESNRIYYTTKAGNQNLAQIISNARKESDRLVSNVSKQIMESMQGAGKRMAFLGGVNRGTKDSNGVLDFIHSKIIEVVQAGANREEYLTGDSISSVRVSDGSSFCFQIHNKSNKPLFVNIVRLPAAPSEKLVLCLDIGYTMNEPYLMVGAESSLLLSDYQFVPDSVPHTYMLIASEKAFDCQALKLLLKKSETDCTETADSTVYFYLFK